MIQISNKVETLKPSGKPRAVFENRCWVDPAKPGANGPMRWNNWNTSTILTQAGLNNKGPIVTPNSCAVAYAATWAELANFFNQPLVFGRQGFIYSRLGTVPGFDVESAYAATYGCGDALVTSSGMAAISQTLLSLVTAGDNIIAHRNLYGCTDSLLRGMMTELGVEVRFVDMRDPKNVEGQIDGRTRAVLFETPSNPLLDLIDIRGVANAVKNRCLIIVDNTFASIITQNPFKQGAHVVVNSMTKSTGGEGTGIGGIILGSGELIDNLFMARKDIGGSLPADESMKFLLGMHTLEARYTMMQGNAVYLAEELKQHPKVEAVIYPLYDPAYQVLKDSGQMKGSGHMIIVEVSAAVEKIVNLLKLAKYGVSLGAYTSVTDSWTTTHRFVPENVKRAIGMKENQIRISVGREDKKDILDDFVRALDKAA